MPPRTQAHAGTGAPHGAGGSGQSTARWMPRRAEGLLLAAPGGLLRLPTGTDSQSHLFAVHSLAGILLEAAGREADPGRWGMLRGFCPGKEAAGAPGSPLFGTSLADGRDVPDGHRRPWVSTSPRYRRSHLLGWALPPVCNPRAGDVTAHRDSAHGPSPDPSWQCPARVISGESCAPSTVSMCLSPGRGNGCSI